jgi:hypothetical protein
LALILAVFGNIPAFSQAPTNLFDEQHSLAFAHFLETQHRYDLALDEYRRIDQMAPGKLEVRMGMLHCYAASNLPTDGIVAYEKWDYHPHLAPAELRTKYVGLHFQSRDYSRLGRKLETGIGLREPDKTRIHLQLALYQRDWVGAHKLFESFEIQHVKRNKLTYEPIIQAVDDLHYRKPWVGSMLSIVPGGGQLYAGQWVSGLSSLLLVGVTGFEAYRLLRKRGFDNVAGWGLAAVSCSFYVANIYGGHRSVRRYNEKQDAGIQAMLDRVAVRDF